MFLLKNLRKPLAILLLLSLLSAILETMGIAIVIPIIPAIMSDSTPESAFYLNRLQLIFGSNQLALLAIIPAAFLLKNLLLVGLKYLSNKEIFGIKASLENSLLKSYIFSSYEDKIELDTAVVSNSILHEVQIFTFNVMQALIVISTELFLLIFISAALLIYDWVLFASVLLPSVGICVVGYSVASRFQVKWGESNKAANQALYSILEVCIGAIKEIQIYGAHDFILNKFKASTRQVADTYTSSQTLAMASLPLLETLVVGLLFGGLYYLSEVVVVSKERIVEIMSIYGICAIRLVPGFSRITMSINQIKFGNRSLKSLGLVALNARKFENSSAKFDKFSNCKISKFDPEFKSLQFRNVGFSFGAKEKVLAGINVKVSPGKLIGIYGNSGSGKSTFVNIMAGLLNPSEGEIFLNDSKVEGEEIGNLSSYIGYVPQDVYILDSTLAENIAFGCSIEEMDIERIKVLCVLLGLDSLLSGQLCPTNVRLVSRGGNISGGQRARLGLARALYRNPQILILDEVTSSLDPQTEAAIMHDVILNRESFLAVILVSHKIKNFDSFDEIWKIESGVLRKASLNEKV